MTRESLIQNLKKLFVILFTCGVFVYLLKSDSGVPAFQTLELKRKLTVSIIAILLLQVISYLEILVVRDQLWVMEGSLKTIREIRDAFLEPANSPLGNFKKYLVLVNALVIIGFFAYLQKEQPIIQATIGVLLVILFLVVILLEIMVIRSHNALIAGILETKGEQMLKPLDQSFATPEANQPPPGGEAPRG